MFTVPSFVSMDAVDMSLQQLNRCIYTCNTHDMLERPKDIQGLVIPVASNETSAARRLVATAPVVVITIKQRTQAEAAQTAADFDAPELVMCEDGDAFCLSNMKYNMFVRYV